MKSSNGNEARVEFQQEGRGVLLGAYAGKYADQQGANTVLVECKEKQKVWVACAGDGTVIEGGIESTFSGTLIQKL